MDKTEKGSYATIKEEDITEVEFQTPRQKRNLVMIYLLILAEAIMASSLSSQIEVLVPSTSTCVSTDTSFLRSILECAYYFGSSIGLLWGCAADRFGRRRIALVGLGGMSTCCLSMGFATSFQAFALLRFVAGALSSATTISGLAMLADVTHASSNRTKIVAHLPLVGVCGSIGPLASHLWHEALDGRLFQVFARFPGLSGQIACAGLVFTISGAEMWLLEETLPVQRRGRTTTRPNADDEKAAFLSHRLSDDDEGESLNISIIEALNDDAAPLPSKIGITQLLTAPTVIILLASYSLLSLHSSTFEVVLPHIGHTASNEGGMGLPCQWLQPITTVVTVLAAIRISRLVPCVVPRHGLLTVFRRVSFMFPPLYATVPVLGFVIGNIGGSAIVSAIISTVAMYVKTTLAGAAQVLVLLLVLSAAPDAYSTGTVLGIISISELFKALAVGASGLSYYLSNDHGVMAVNGALWTALVLTALVGVVVTRKLRETPRVGADIPEDCFVWQDVFDSESDSGEGL
jgi:MFS family permease